MQKKTKKVIDIRIILLLQWKKYKKIQKMGKKKTMKQFF